MLSFGIVSRVVVEYVGLVAIAEQMCLSQPKERWAEGLHFGTKVVSYSPKRDSKPRPICGVEKIVERHFLLSRAMMIRGDDVGIDMLGRPTP